MTEIDFGTLVSAVVDELSTSANELFGDEKRDSDLAVQRYKRNIVDAIRRVFDDAEAACSNCGAVLGKKARFCSRCGMPLSAGAAGELLADLLAESVGTTADTPSFLEAIARLREEQPEQWDALIRMLAPATKT